MPPTQLHPHSLGWVQSHPSACLSLAHRPPAPFAPLASPPHTHRRQTATYDAVLRATLSAANYTDDANLAVVRDLLLPRVLGIIDRRWAAPAGGRGRGVGGQGGGRIARPCTWLMPSDKQLGGGVKQAPG